MFNVAVGQVFRNNKSGSEIVIQKIGAFVAYYQDKRGTHKSILISELAHPPYRLVISPALLAAA